MNYQRTTGLMVQSTNTERPLGFSMTNEPQPQPQQPLAVVQLGAVDLIRGLSNQQVADVGKELFPTNKWQRCVWHSWMDTVRLNSNPIVNPSSLVVNMIGEGGFGKSGLIYSMKPLIEAWLSNMLGRPITWQVITRTLAGIVDISDLVGIPNVDREAGVTVLYPPKAFPKDNHPDTVGIIFTDDFNRGGEGVVAGFMEFICTRRINDYKLPDGFGLAAATNPSGKSNKVRTLDGPQFTRFWPIAYVPSRSIFLEQLALQGVPASVIGFFRRHPELAPVPDGKDYLPEIRPLNWRNSTVFGHLTSTAMYDDEVQDILINSFLGPNLATAFRMSMAGDDPLEPHEILGMTAEELLVTTGGKTPEQALPDFTNRLQTMLNEKKIDLISLTTMRLGSHINSMKTIELSEGQFSNLCSYLIGLSPSMFGDFVRRVIHEGCKHKDAFTRHDSPYNMFQWNVNADGVGAIYLKIKELRERMAFINTEIEKHSAKPPTAQA